MVDDDPVLVTVVIGDGMRVGFHGNLGLLLGGLRAGGSEQVTSPAQHLAWQHKYDLYLIFINTLFF